MQGEHRENSYNGYADRRKSAKFGDIFGDVTQGTNMTEADDVPLLMQRSEVHSLLLKKRVNVIHG